MKWYGSVTNRILESRKQTEKIEVGTGVTEICWSDRHAYEVVKVIDDKHLLIRRCDSKRIDDNGMSDCQEYEYTLIPYEEYYISEELLNDECTMFNLKMHCPNLYKKIIKGKVGDVYGDNNKKLVLTKKGWRERMPNGKLSVSKYVVGLKEEYYDYSF